MSILTELTSGDVAVRSLPDLPTESVLRSILQSIDDGVLLTDLEHRSLACNRRFGGMFGLDPEEVVRCGVQELRDRVAPYIVDSQSWRESLESVYADPEGRYEGRTRPQARRGDDPAPRRHARLRLRRPSLRTALDLFRRDRSAPSPPQLGSPARDFDARRSRSGGQPEGDLRGGYRPLRRGDSDQHPGRRLPTLPPQRGRPRPRRSTFPAFPR